MSKNLPGWGMSAYGDDVILNPFVVPTLSGFRLNFISRVSSPESTTDTSTGAAAPEKVSNLGINNTKK